VRSGHSPPPHLPLARPPPLGVGQFACLYQGHSFCGVTLSMWPYFPASGSHCPPPPAPSPRLGALLALSSASPRVLHHPLSFSLHPACLDQPQCPSSLPPVSCYRVFPLTGPKLTATSCTVCNVSPTALRAGREQGQGRFWSPQWPQHSARHRSGTYWIKGIKERGG